MRRLRRWALRFLAGVLVVLAVAALAFHSWISGEAAAMDVLGTTLNGPSELTWLVDETTSTPRPAQRVIAGVPSTVVRPGGRGPWPAIIFVNGATQQGRFEPHVVRLGLGLARAGFLVVVPDLPGLRQGEITLRTVHALEAVATRVRTRSDVRGGRVGMLGVSVGGSIALLAAESPAVRGHVSTVAAIAPYIDLEQMTLLATTGYYQVGHRFVRYDSGSFLTLALARSLTGSLPPDSQTQQLLTDLLDTSESSSTPTAEACSLLAEGRLSGGAVAVARLVCNRDPHRFAALWAALPPSLQQIAADLSPITGVSDLRFPVYLASSPHDEYFPPSQSEELAARAPDAHVTVSSTLSHVIPEPSPDNLDALWNFDGFVVSALQSFEHCASTRGCPP
ncbi:MAG TPA: alpha/beta fold hydrolase [Thermoleophilia bacterium]|nr:alpha/beta fold hydrolase [Thermoleophilia bacterium]